MGRSPIKDGLNFFSFLSFIADFNFQKNLLNSVIVLYIIIFSFFFFFSMLSRCAIGF